MSVSEPNETDRNCNYIPSLAEIAAAAARIRAGWSEAEMRVRLGLSREPRPMEVQEVWSGDLCGAWIIED